MTIAQALVNFSYLLGDFLEKVEKGLSPDVTPIRTEFGKVLDVLYSQGT